MTLPQNLPLTPAALGALAGVLVVAIGGYFGLMWPATREVSTLEAQLATLSAEAAGLGAAAPPVTDVERASWEAVEARVRDRFVAPDDLFGLLVTIAKLARDSGMAVEDVQLEGVIAAASGPAEPLAFNLPLPPGLVLNPGTVRLTVRHQYRALTTFFDRLAAGDTYVALHSLDVRRVDNLLHSDIRLVSLRWGQAP